MLHPQNFPNTFTTKFMWKVVTSFNLNPSLKLFLYSPILTNNNLLLKIYCKNIVITFLKVFYSLFSLHFIHTLLLLLLFFFPSSTRCPYLYPLLLFALSPSFKNIPGFHCYQLNSHSPALSLSLSFFVWFCFFFFFVFFVFFLFFFVFCFNLILEGICIKMP